jgi:hypothetical protein
MTPRRRTSRCGDKELKVSLKRKELGIIATVFYGS